MALSGAAALGVLFRVPRRYLHLTVVLGGIGALAPLLRPSPFPQVVWIFGVSFLIGSLSHLLARWTDSPSQGFLIPGVIFLVPGSLIYQGFNRVFAESLGEAWPHLTTAVMGGIAISFGLLLANWLAPSRGTL